MVTVLSLLNRHSKPICSAGYSFTIRWCLLLRKAVWKTPHNITYMEMNIFSCKLHKRKLAELASVNQSVLHQSLPKGWEAAQFLGSINILFLLWNRCTLPDLFLWGGGMTQKGGRSLNMLCVLDINRSVINSKLQLATLLSIPVRWELLYLWDSILITQMWSENCLTDQMWKWNRLGLWH